jgi:hypothetical protein
MGASTFEARLTRRAAMMFPLLVAAQRPASAQTGAVAVVTMNGQNFEYAESAGTNMGSLADPLAPLLGKAPRFTMSCHRVTRPDCPLSVDFRRIDNWSCIVFEYGDCWAKTQPNLGPYSVRIDGQTIAVPAHWTFARWRWQSGKWPFPMTPIPELVAARLLPRFDPAVNGGTAHPLPVAKYTPMGLAGITGGMGATGERADIGYVTDWQAEYICTQSPNSLVSVVAQGEAGGTLPWMQRDSKTGALIDAITQHPTATSYWPPPSQPYIPTSDAVSRVSFTITGPPGTALPWQTNIRDGGYSSGSWLVSAATSIPASGTLTTACQSNNGLPAPGAPIGPFNTGITGVKAAPVQGSYNPGSGIGIDISHEPAVAYLPFLLTGDPWHLENLQAQVMQAVLAWPSARTPVPLNGGSIRMIAWHLRNLMQAAKTTPDTVPSWLLPRKPFQTLLDSIAAQYRKHIASPTLPTYATFHSIGWPTGDYGSAGYPAGTWQMLWQEDFAIAMAGWCAHMHRGAWIDIARWHVQSAIARTDGRSGWSRAVPAPYQFRVRDTPNAPYYASWREAWAANARLIGRDPAAQIDGDLGLGSAGAADYPNGTRGALALCVQAGITEAQPSKDWISSQLLASFRARRTGMEYKWSVA